MFESVGSKVMFEIVELEAQSASGLYLGKADTGAATYARVLSAGPKCEQVETGDTIIVPLMGYMPYEVEGKKVGTAEEDIILAVRKA